PHHPDEGGVRPRAHRAAPRRLTNTPHPASRVAPFQAVFARRQASFAPFRYAAPSTLPCGRATREDHCATAGSSAALRLGLGWLPGLLALAHGDHLVSLLARLRFRLPPRDHLSSPHQRDDYIGYTSERSAS